MTGMTQLPVACTLNEPDLAKRRAGLFADLARRRQEARWLPEGIALRYSSEQGALALLGGFIQLESQCCPFLRFHLTVEPGGGPIWLELTGPPGTREFLAHEIGDPEVA
ncbi:MAG: hypothetical protein ACREKJ_04160 [Candidatus Rokuibacteriota bacterium]